MGPVAQILPDGKRLHLQYGPIDLIIGADGARQRAFEAARHRFSTILEELVEELPALRTRMGPQTDEPQGAVARRMHQAVHPTCENVFVTRMAAVAGAVADEVLQAMTDAAELCRAYVNNGGDIALHLTPDTQFQTAMQGHGGQDLGQIKISHNDPVRGIATSGRHGRSLSLGIADSVTVLARNAASADVAATLIANAVDLEGHPAIKRQPACALVDDSDLGTHAVVVDCANLSRAACKAALAAGKTRAMCYQSRGLIYGSALFLQDHSMTTDTRLMPIPIREPHYV